MKDDDQVETIRERYQQGYYIRDGQVLVSPLFRDMNFLLTVCNERRARIIELEEEVSRLEDWSREEDGSDL